MIRFRKKFILKLSIVLIFWIIYGLFFKLLYPITTTGLALNQFKDSVSSYTNYGLYQTIWDYSFLALILISIITFVPETINLFKKIRGVK